MRYEFLAALFPNARVTSSPDWTDGAACTVSGSRRSNVGNVLVLILVDPEGSWASEILLECTKVCSLQINLTLTRFCSLYDQPEIEYIPESKPDKLTLLWKA
jgi:hypothetical protein